LEITIVAKLKLYVNKNQKESIIKTIRSLRNALNYVSEVIFNDNDLNQFSLHKKTYRILREQYGLRSQMAQNTVKTAIAKYKSANSNGHERTLVHFKKPEYDMVFNRDYSLVKGLFSINSLDGRLKIPFETKGMEHFFDKQWQFGTAKLVYKKGNFFLHIPMTKEFDETSYAEISNVVGVDLGLNFIAVAYDSKGKTTFFKGRHIKTKRAQFVKARKTLQQRQTSSARKRLRAIGSRESRWMTDVNHQVSKALVEQAGEKALIVLEDLTGIRQATERIRRNNRYVSVSWAFYQLRQFIEYKALLHKSKTIAVSPKHTSQTCPKCGHTEKLNRNKKLHVFKCKACGYTSNDDRIGGMNLHRKGIEYLEQKTA
jgi:IS605 OrfB family transposase